MKMAPRRSQKFQTRSAFAKGDYRICFILVKAKTKTTGKVHQIKTCGQRFNCEEIAM